MVIPHKISRMLWVPLLTLVVGIPVVSWGVHAPVYDSFYSLFLFLTLFGQLTGIVGAQLFSFALLLSARLRSIEYLFGGLDKMYVIHHRVGVIAFSFLAIHPLILAFRFVEDGMSEVMMFLVPINNTLARDFGIYALLCMMGLLFVTFYGTIFSYKSLKNAHRFMGAAFFLAGLHMFLIPSSMSSDIVLKVSCLGMALIGLLAYTYRTLLGTWLVPRALYQVKDVNVSKPGITAVTLSPVNRPISHLPGQFSMFSFPASKVVPKEEHPFTISSAYDNGDLQFSAKCLGDYTKLLPSLEIGAEAYIEGPFGEFSYIYGEKRQIWVAGGIGVTPFVSMALDLLKQEESEYIIDFFYSVRGEGDGAYKDVFDKLTQKYKSFTFHFMPSDTSGYITGELLAQEVSDITKRDIFVCGPPGMMSAIVQSLETMGVKGNRIHSEYFSLLK